VKWEERMTPDEFVSKLRMSVVEENVAIYKQLFSGTMPDDAEDAHWKRVLTLFRSISIEAREVFFEVIRQTSVDAVSNVLGVIDGTSSLEGCSDNFKLLYGGSSEGLEGDLQSIFLEQE
jgi:hypothetical protein